jgi:hypothetical protein
MIVFLHLPKTGGSTFQFILENTFGISACHSNHTKKPAFEPADLAFARKIFPRLRSIAGHNLIDPLEISPPDPFYITFLREPIARVISQYQDSVVSARNPRTFEQSLLIDDSLENLQVKLLAGGRNLDKAKKFLEKCAFVGLTEKFDLSLHILDQLSPFKLNLNYKRRRVTPCAIKRALKCDNRLIEMARERNHLDLELYSFAATEIFPALCEKTGCTPSTQVRSYEKYSHEIKFRFMACNLFNMCLYRQLCKLRRRFIKPFVPVPKQPKPQFTPNSGG